MDTSTSSSVRRSLVSWSAVKVKFNSHAKPLQAVAPAVYVTISRIAFPPLPQQAASRTTYSMLSLDGTAFRSSMIEHHGPELVVNENFDFELTQATSGKVNIELVDTLKYTDGQTKKFTLLKSEIDIMYLPLNNPITVTLPAPTGAVMYLEVHVCDLQRQVFCEKVDSPLTPNVPSAMTEDIEVNVQEMRLSRTDSNVDSSLDNLNPLLGSLEKSIDNTGSDGETADRFKRLNVDHNTGGDDGEGGSGRQSSAPASARYHDYEPHSSMDSPIPPKAGGQQEFEPEGDAALSHLHLAERKCVECQAVIHQDTLRVDLSLSDLCHDCEAKVRAARDQWQREEDMAEDKDQVIASCHKCGSQMWSTVGCVRKGIPVVCKKCVKNIIRTSYPG
eukprot:GFYU01012003.1.p1 GENE.GFYU01012003.1~~GFYU01012003.1.p1  ORF type:complete len:389 (-),score=57.73 GFYU01012003.1:233-1399(-)